MHLKSFETIYLYILTLWYIKPL